MLIENNILTDRFILRSLEPACQHDNYLSWLHDTDVTKYLEVRFSPPSSSDLGIYISEMNKSHNNLLLGIFDRSINTRHIGNIKIGPINYQHKSASIGILIGNRDYWNKGAAKETLLAINEYSFKILGLTRMEAGIYSNNIFSIRAFLSANYQIEGIRMYARQFHDIRVHEFLLGLSHIGSIHKKEL